MKKINPEKSTLAKTVCRSRPSCPLLAVLCGAITLISADITAAAERVGAHWVMSAPDATPTTIPSAEGDAGKLTAREVIGFSLQDDGAVEGGKALSFDGKQICAFYAANKLRWEGDLSIDLDIKPSSAATQDGTLLYLFKNFELRYVFKSKTLWFVVYCGEASTVIRANLPLDQWNKVTAKLTGEVMQLTVNGETVQGRIEAGTKMGWDDGITKFDLAVGSTDGGRRPFQGGLANIIIKRP